jgi:predicted phage terminase large subunit-like protein
MTVIIENQKNLIEQIINDQASRREMAKTFIGFKIIYLPHYLTLKPPSFEPELNALFENWKIKFLSIVGFRGSAKSTNASLALPLWAALENKAKFIIIIRDTDAQARIDIANIRHELEDNELLIFDYGDQSKGISKVKEWTQHNLLLANGTRIMSRSRGQRIRGLRHRQYRPDLIIIDDPEELEKVQSKEYRDKTERWLRGDIIPAIEETNARLIVIGNILHTDALMTRLKNDPIFLHREFPLIDDEGKITWRAKYPTQDSIKYQEKKVGRTAFLREYMLKVVPPEGQEVKEEWIQYYEKLPEGIIQAGVGVDFAISKKETADFTAMVYGVSALVEGVPKIFILPNPVNQRLSLHETEQQAISLERMLSMYTKPIFYAEDVGYQKAAIERLQNRMLAVEPMKAGQDKRARLRTAATFIQNGTVLFPRRGAEDLIDQLVNFGVTDHDDLMDAFCYLIFGLSKSGMEMPEVVGLI